MACTRKLYSLLVLPPRFLLNKFLRRFVDIIYFLFFRSSAGFVKYRLHHLPGLFLNSLKVLFALEAFRIDLT